MCYSIYVKGSNNATRDTNPNTTQHNTMEKKQFNTTLTALLAAAKRFESKQDIASLAEWCDKAKQFEAVAAAAAKAARIVRKDESVPLSKRMGVGILTVKLPSKLKPRRLFKAANDIAKQQVKRVKTISKFSEILHKTK